MHENKFSWKKITESKFQNTLEKLMGRCFFSCFTYNFLRCSMTILLHKTFLKIKVLKIVPYFIMSVPKDIVFILGQKNLLIRGISLVFVSLGCRIWNVSSNLRNVCFNGKSKKSESQPSVFTRNQHDLLRLMSLTHFYGYFSNICGLGGF